MEQVIEIMDTTLRDGEQTDGVSFNAFEKQHIAGILLEQLRVDRIEIASARVSAGELRLVRDIFAWAAPRGLADRIEILGFTDHRASVEWIGEAGGHVINLLTKGSLRHCEEQLRKMPREHFADIERTILFAAENGLRVNVYLEDWSNGFLQSNAYVTELLGVLARLPVHRALLPDTLGIMSPWEVEAGVGDCRSRYPDLQVDFHGHNDYGLAVANSLAAVRAGARGLHATVNGLGERAGNTALEALNTALIDKLRVRTAINEQAITDASRLVAAFSRKRTASNQPIVGQDVYTHTAGIHADGDKKNLLYSNQILPERFGRQRVYALGKLAGRASIANNLKLLGIELSSDREAQLLARVVQLGEQKKLVTADDLPFLITDLFGSIRDTKIRVKNASVETRLGQRPSATVEVEYRGELHARSAGGDGGYDAFMKALGEIAIAIGLEMPSLVDYQVHIPPGGMTDALVETVITWQMPEGGRHFTTVGVDPDQTVAAIRATEKMLNRLVAVEGEEEPAAVPISVPRP